MLSAVLSAALPSAALYLALGHYHINFADEGYLWYGVLRVLEGEVPFRDFQSYDPGRYAWCALWSSVFGSGLLGIRAAAAVFQALGLTFGVLVARRFFKNDAWMFPIACLLAAWMFPRHKMFDPGLAMIATWSTVRLLERPSGGRYLWLGVCIGLGGWFGRNHGVYAGLGALLAVGYLAWKRPTAGSGRRLILLGRLALGVLLGYSPVLLTLLLTPGFADAFVAALLDLLRKGANIPLDYPWPWKLSFGHLEGLRLLSALATGLAFLLPVLALAPGWMQGLRAPRSEEENALLPEHAARVGTAILGLLYIHHVSVRSDPAHLAQCIQPVLLLMLGLPPMGRPRILGLSALGLVTYLFAIGNHSTLQYYAPWHEPLRTQGMPVGRETIFLSVGQARYIELIRTKLAPRLKPEDQIFIAPSRATLYPILGKRAPVPQIYLFWYATDEEQRGIIDALETQRVKWILIADSTVDDREDLYFANTHPLVWSYIASHYNLIPKLGIGKAHILFRRRAE